MFLLSHLMSRVLAHGTSPGEEFRHLLAVSRASIVARTGGAQGPYSRSLLCSAQKYRRKRHAAKNFFRGANAMGVFK
jgi:hypothetical protein